MFNEIKLSENSSLKLFIHDESAKLCITSRPLVVILPGGAYLYCSDREAEMIAYSYLAEGFNAIIYRYTCGLGHEVPYEEGLKVFEYINQNCEAWGVDKDKIFINGFSAGGHLALALGLEPKNNISGMILGYPAVWQEPWYIGEKPIPNLIERVTDKAPKAFIFACCDDKAVSINNTLELMNALNKNGVNFESHIFSQGGHGLSLANTTTSSGNSNNINDRVALWFKLSVSWIKSNFGDITFKEGSNLADCRKVIYTTVGEAVENPKLLKVLSKVSDCFSNPEVIKVQKDCPLMYFLPSLGVDNKHIIKLSIDLELALNE